MEKEATRKRKSLVSGRVEIEHGPYRIIAGDVGEVCKAVAYLGMGGMRPIEAVEGDTVETAVALMMETLDAHLAEFQRQRRDGIPGSSEYLSALVMLPTKVQELAYSLAAIAARPAGTQVSLLEIERELRLAPGDGFAELQRLGRKLSAFLGYEPVTDELDKPLMPLLVFSNVVGNANAETPEIIFHPEFCAAVWDLPRRQTNKILVASRR